jgi:beta-glucosidase-like glycosyl hydrolase
VSHPYQDPGLPVGERVRDLVSRMTIEEKVGQLFQRQIEVGPEGTLVEESAIFLPHGTSHAISELHLSHVYAILLPEDPAAIARWHNRVQAVAAGTRLGIPVTVSSDPIHADAHNIATGVRAPGFSEWPESLGLAALHDPEAVREFAEVAAREYAAVGFRSAIHPQIDLATEPRWPRQQGTLGADAELAGQLARAYIEGFQGPRLGPTSVACMAKHFPGGGAQKDGEDPHFPYGREQVYPAGRFEEHLRPFAEAIDAGVSAVMPYYSLPLELERNGQAIEPVGFAFNKAVITGILREELAFDGVVCTDFGILSPYESHGVEVSPARAWGVEHLDRAARLAKAIDAGCDQFGGELCPDVLLRLLDDGTVEEARVDESVARILKVKFELGLFDDPFVDEEAAGRVVGNEAAVAAGFLAQVSSLVLLDQADPALLPLAPTTRVYVEGAEPEAFAGTVEVVDRPEDAEAIVVRLPGPFEPREEFILESLFHAGSLDLPDETVARVRDLAELAPVVVDVRLERPAILTPLVGVATVLIGSFGSSDSALARALADPEAMVGRLPFELPASMASVERHPSDLADGHDEVLFRRSHRTTAG